MAEANEERAVQPGEVSPAGVRRGVGLGWMDAALLLMAFIWGSNFVLVKAAVMQFQPLVFTLLRFVVAGVALLAVLRGPAARQPLTRRDWLHLLALGLVGNVVYQPFFITGLKYTTAGNGSLIIAASPAVMAALGHALGVEQVGRRAWAGIGLSFFGLALVTLGGPEEVSFAPSTMLGNAMLVISALGWAGGTLLMQPLLRRLPVLTVTTLSHWLSVPVLLAIALPELRAQDWSATNAAGWLALAASAVLSISLAYVIWMRGVKQLGGARAAVYANLMPVFAVVTGIVFLGEQVTALQLAGAAGVIGGITVTKQGG